jgi:hypothetical protein
VAGVKCEVLQVTPTVGDTSLPMQAVVQVHACVRARAHECTCVRCDACSHCCRNAYPCPAGMPPRPHAPTPPRPHAPTPPRPHAPRSTPGVIGSGSNTAAGRRQQQQPGASHPGAAWRAAHRAGCQLVRTILLPHCAGLLCRRTKLQGLPR